MSNAQLASVLKVDAPTICYNGIRHSGTEAHSPTLIFQTLLLYENEVSCMQCCYYTHF